MIEDEEVRRWCAQMARISRKQHISRGGAPYLTRHFLAGWRPGKTGPMPAVYLHHFVASDPHTQVHSHPWAWARSLILAGSYTEERCDAEPRTFGPGDINDIEADDRHRITLHGEDVWTLFLTAPYLQPWGFDDRC